MKIYNKLIRDKIPEIIAAGGNQCDIRVLNDNDYLTELNKKLQEELKEYNESGEILELADLAEVIYAIAKHKGLSAEKFDALRLDKAKKRGGFEEKLFLVSVTEKEEKK